MSRRTPQAREKKPEFVDNQKLEEDDEDTEDDYSDEEGDDDDDDDGYYEDEENVRKSDESKKLSANTQLSMLERLQALKQENEADSFASVNNTNKRSRQSRKSNIEGDEDRESKRSRHAPAVMRSDRPVRRLRDTSIANKTAEKKYRDPRFSAASGSLNEDKFHQAFNFLEQYQEDEVRSLQSALKKTKGKAKGEQLALELTKKQQEISERRRSLKIRNKLSEIRSQERAKVKDGKKPFYLKSSAVKQVALEQKFDDLKKSGKLHKYMEKQRRKNSNKDHRHMPNTRRAFGEGEN